MHKYKMCSTHGTLHLAVLACVLLAVTAKQQHHHHHNLHNGQQAAGEQRKDKTPISEDVMYNYLMQFDYLPKSDLETGSLRSVDELKDAIRNLQSFGNIPVTGEIDPATAKLIQKPRCGVGDKKHAYNFSPDNLDHDNSYSLRVRRYVLQGPRWEKLDLTWSLVNQSMTDAAKVRSLVSRALRVWENNSKLTFREVYSDQADIQVLFTRRDHGDGYKFDGPGQVLAHAFYPGVGRGGDAHFDADETWEFDGSSADGVGTNFLNVALHELGHSLGLGHSSDSNAVMFPWYQNNEVDGKLPDDDRNGIQELYGAKEKTWGPYRPRTTTTTTTIPTRVYYPQRTHDYPQRYPNYYPPNYPRNNYPRNNYPHPTTTTTTSTTTQRPRYNPTARHYPTSKYPSKPRKLKPDSCMTTYDAISMIRSELFIFRGQFLWRIGAHGLYHGYPTETRRHWAALPEDFNKVDAVYENHERKIIFFIGRHYYVFDSVTLLPGYPQPLTTLGLPHTLSHIDAAFVWGHNNRTYLTSGSLYWRLDDATGKVELDYPRDMSIWSGVGYNIDAAFQYKNGKTYFFKNKGYWEFDDNRMKVAHPRPKLSAREWMKCPRSVNDVDEEQRWTSPLVSGQNEQLNSNNNDGDSGARANFKYSLCSLALLPLLHMYCAWRS